MKQFGKIALAILPLFVFLVVKSPVSAAFNFYIDNVSTTAISAGGQEVDVNLVIADLPSESYFRVAMQKESGGSYFGYVKNNNGDWSVIQPLSGDCTIYYRIIDTSTSSLALKFKVGDDAIIDNGNYKLKAHRFTKTCTSNTEATNSATITVSLPTPTSTPTQTPTPVSANTQTPTPTKTPTAIPVTVSAVVPTDVLGESTDSADLLLETLSPLPTKEEVIKDKNAQVLGENNFPKIMISLGIIFSSACGILAFRAYRKRKNEIRNL